MERFSAAFVILAVVLIVAIYALRVRPQSRRQWYLITLTIAFMMWLLLGLDVPTQ